MKRYLNKVREYIKSLTLAKLQQIPREENIEVDSLAKTAFADSDINEQVKV